MYHTYEQLWMMMKIRVINAFLSTRAETSVIAIDTKKMLLEIQRFLSNTALHCLLNPTRKDVPASVSMFPSVYVSAKRVGLPVTRPIIEPQDSASISSPRLKHTKKAVMRSFTVSSGRHAASSSLGVSDRV
jgi:hypothetical protein